MTRALLFTLFCAVSAHAVNAFTKPEADSLAAIGQRAYAAADYAGALAAFDSVAASYRSADLCLALGNTHYKLGDVARAILWYERGLRLAPNHADLQANLDLSNEQVRDRIRPSAAIPLGETWNSLRGDDPDAWARWSLIACTLLFAALAWAVLSRGWAKQAGWALTALFALSLAASLAMAWARHRELGADDEGIVLSAKVEALAEPRDGSKALFVLHRGAKVNALAEADGWCEVRLPDGTTGWLRAAAIERI
jgi:tetratricopeptide (TPR) repeat protein